MHLYETRSHLYEFTTNLVIDENSGVLEVHHEKF